MLKFNIDVSKIAEQFKDFKEDVETELKRGVASLAAMTHAKVLEKAQSELHSSREKYVSNLTFEEIHPGLWIITLNEPAMWIEEGIPDNHDMKPDLLKNPKLSSSGKKYKIIPFQHSAPPSQLTPHAQALVAGIRYNLKKRGVPFKKIEKNAEGKAKLGKLHDFDFGGEIPGRGNTPIMNGVSIYQSMTKSGNIRRDIFTFRTVTDGPESVSKWIHPGMKAKKYMDYGLDWAMKEWESTIFPEIIDRWK